MAQSKIVFLDVDGTITDYENNVPQSAKDAIKAARANGHRVYMCTGRSKPRTRPRSGRSLRRHDRRQRLLCGVRG